MKKDILQREGVECLKKFAETLNSHNIPFWLEFGTLLGAIRERGFISHDNDMDFGAFLNDARKIHEVLTHAGFRLIRDYHVAGENGLEQTYRLGQQTIDIFYFYTINGKDYFTNGFARLQKVKKNVPLLYLVHEFKFTKFGLKKTSFLGVEVYIPDNNNQHTIEVYGENYMIPDPLFSRGLNRTDYSLKEKVGLGIIEDAESFV